MKWLPRIGKFLGLTLALLLILLWQAPASWLDGGLRAATRGTLILADPQGRLWQGSGTLQALLPRGAAVTLAPLRWTLRYTPPAGLRFAVVSARDGALLLDASAHGGGVMLHSAHLELPAGLLGSASPTLRDADLGGQVTFTADELGQQAGRFSGKGEMRWQGASASLAGNQSLGDYRIRLDGTGAGLAAQIDSLGQPALVLAGDGAWQPGRTPRLNLTATPSEARRQALDPLLRLIGRETQPGVYQLQWDGNVGAASL